MTQPPKEKAKELVDKFMNHSWNGEDNLWTENAKQCALIAVDEILNAVTTIADKKYDYWQQVKTEIQNL